MAQAFTTKMVPKPFVVRTALALASMATFRWPNPSDSFAGALSAPLDLPSNFQFTEDSQPDANYNQFFAR